MQQSEGKFKQRVVRDLRDAFGEDLHVLATQERSRGGVPDLLLCLKGAYIAIELKLDGGKPTPLQQVYLDRITRAGGYAFCATPSGWELQLDILKERFKA